MGVANNRSIAWGIAKACREHGAELAFTYQGDALKKRVEPLAAEVGGLVAGHCDVTDAASIDAVFDTVQKRVGRARLRRACGRVLRPQRTVRPLRRYQRGQLHQDDADQLLLVHRDCAARRKADAEWRRDAHADLLRRGEVAAALQRDGRGEGRAGSLGALSRRRPRRQEHPRQRDLGRADQDAGGFRHRRLPLHPEMERVQLAAAAQRLARRGRQRRRLSALRPVARA